MSAQKPATLCHLRKNYLLDSQRGFVDTFNWIVDWVDEQEKSKEKESKEIVETALVTDVSYNQSTGVFSKKTRKFKVKKIGDETTTGVFTATPISEE